MAFDRDSTCRIGLIVGMGGATGHGNPPIVRAHMQADFPNFSTMNKAASLLLLLLLVLLMLLACAQTAGADDARDDMKDLY